MNLLDPDCGMDPEERREILLHTDAGRAVIAAEEAAFFAVLFTEGVPPGWVVSTYLRGPNKHSPCLRKGEGKGSRTMPIPEGYEVGPDRQLRKKSVKPAADASAEDVHAAAISYASAFADYSGGTGYGQQGNAPAAPPSLRPTQAECVRRAAGAGRRAGVAQRQGDSGRVWMEQQHHANSRALARNAGLSNAVIDACFREGYRSGYGVPASIADQPSAALPQPTPAVSQPTQPTQSVDDQKGLSPAVRARGKQAYSAARQSAIGVTSERQLLIYAQRFRHDQDNNLENARLARDTRQQKGYLADAHVVGQQAKAYEDEIARRKSVAESASMPTTPVLGQDAVNQGHRAYAEALREAVANSYSGNEEKALHSLREAAMHENRSRDLDASQDARQHSAVQAHLASRRAEAYALENRLRGQTADATENASKTKGQSLVAASDEMHSKYQQHQENGSVAANNPDLRAAHEETAMAHARQRDFLNTSIARRQKWDRS